MWASSTYSIMLLVCGASVPRVKGGDGCEDISYQYDWSTKIFTSEVCTESDVTNNILLARCSVTPKPANSHNFLLAISYWYKPYVDGQNYSGLKGKSFGNVCEFDRVQEEYICFMRTDLYEVNNSSAQFGCSAHLRWNTPITVGRTIYSIEGISSSSPHGIFWKALYRKGWRPKLALSSNGTTLKHGSVLPYTEGEELTIVCTIVRPFFGPQHGVLWSLEGRPIKEETINKTDLFRSVLIRKFTAIENTNGLQCRHYRLTEQLRKLEHAMPMKVILMLRKPTRNVSSNETLAGATTEGTSERTEAKGVDAAVWGSVTGCLLFAAGVTVYCWRNCRDRRRSKKIIKYESSASAVTEEPVYSVPLPRATRQREPTHAQVVYADLNLDAAGAGGVAFVNSSDNDNYVEIIGVVHSPRPFHLHRTPSPLCLLPSY